MSQIKFYLIEDSKVSIKVFDHLGNQIIFLEKWYNSGENIENIDLSNEPSGIYFYTIEANGDREIQKIVLIK